VLTDEADGRTRYRMLETLRQFGRDRLVASGDTTATRGRHLVWAVVLAESSPPMGHLPPPEIVAETDNLRIALEWACDTGAYESGLRIMSSAWFGHLDERRRMLKRLLPFADRTPIDVQGKALYSAGGLAFMIADWPWGIELFDMAADVNAAAGNAQRTSMSLSYAGSCYWGMRDLHTALAKIEQAIAVAQAARNLDALVRALLVRTWLETERDTGRAEALAIEGEAEAVKLNTVFDLGHFREVRGFIHCLSGEFNRGAEVLAEAMTLFEHIQVNCASHILETAAGWAAMTGRFELGAEILGSARRIREETGDKPRPWERVIREIWLPKIGDSLDPDVFNIAHRRGAQRAFHAALEFARQELRLGAGDAGVER
jgi:tetratricopeptide (TPR) repeat protein